jgi:hypothetical protein
MRPLSPQREDYRHVEQVRGGRDFLDQLLVGPVFKRIDFTEAGGPRHFKVIRGSVADGPQTIFCLAQLEICFFAGFCEAGMVDGEHQSTARFQGFPQLGQCEGQFLEMLSDQGAKRGRELRWSKWKFSL